MKDFRTPGIVEQMLSDHNHETEKTIFLQIDLNKNEMYIERQVQINEKFLPEDYDRAEHADKTEDETLRFKTFEELEAHYRKLIEDALDHCYLDAGSGEIDEVLIDLRKVREQEA